MKSRVTRENGMRWLRRVATPAEAVKYIDAAGFCMLFPVTAIPLPSLYCAVTRRSPDDGVYFDKYFEMIWHWKDELPRRRRAFYAKYFRGRGTFISRRQLPYFLAMRDSAVASGDHYRFYREGRIRDDARVIWEVLEEVGPVATLELRHACKMETTAGNVRFKRAMLDLQGMLVVSHFGVEQETGAWASGRFELTWRAFPEETTAAANIGPEDARKKVAAKFLEHQPGAPPAQLARLFGWSKDQAIAACEGAPAKARNAESGHGR
jgi:hypothetical protein